MMKKTKGDVVGLQRTEPFVAGEGSKVDAKKPVYRNASGYKVREDVNSGLPGGKSGKAGEFGGQDSDNWAAEKNKLVGQSEYQKDSYRARGSDFPVSRVHARTEQDGIGDHGYSEGKNDLVDLSFNREGPRHCEDGGDRAPVPGDRSRVVEGCFSIEDNQGESGSKTGQMSVGVMVDFQTGHIRGGDQGVTDYVPQYNVSVGKPITVAKGAGQKGQQR